MRKVIFLDIDGTLTHNHQDISSRVLQALKEARENGHYIFLCTGRNRVGVNDLLALNIFDGTVCSAGGYIEVNGQKIFEEGMSKEEVSIAQKVFNEYGILYNLEADFKVFQSIEMSRKLAFAFGDNNSEIERLIEQQSEQFNVFSLEKYQSDKDVIQTICYIADNDEIILKAKEQLLPYFHFLIYAKTKNQVVNGELMKKGVNKGEGIKKVMQFLQLPLESSIGFGDSMNDLEMLETCYYSVVMANGDEKIKKYADTICESVEDDGIYHELKRLGLIKR